MKDPDLQHDAPLAPRTTLGVGGPARYLAHCRNAKHLYQTLTWARREQVATFVLGGGSNLLVADAGFAGLVVIYAADDVEVLERRRLDAEEVVRVRVAAGKDWDAFVAWTVEQGLAGLECLSGIPGTVGAVPIQNIGAYGQEVSETIATVWALDLADRRQVSFDAAECGFGYRTSRFKTYDLDRYVITDVDFRLPVHAWGTARYPDLQRRLATPERAPLQQLRDAVLQVRREKSMVLDPHDPNRRSAGSFFVNPIVTPAQAEAVRKAAAELGVQRELPVFDATGGDKKLSAAWLIEEAGFTRGYQLGPVGVSTNHTLALINCGGAHAVDLLRLAARIRHTVRTKFGVTLQPEPRLLGFDRPTAALLDELASAP